MREIGYATLLARVHGGARRTVLGVGLATDLADACVGAAGVRRERMSVPGLAIAVPALAAALLGVVALSPETEPND
ncbi:hypothetical protein [Mycobacterium sp. E1747]|uniref:hypothetical protein n=1 Tax=Mycobacterium sp. E1747 TaxID=1834128 RepID=UPI0012E9B215|nr:hypothetical protein [Mycobacterium sp. E1747]